MVGEIGAALTSMKTAFELAKGIAEIAKEADVRGAVIGLQSKILEAQEAAMRAREREADLHEEIASLRRQIAAFDTWGREKSRYELQIIPPGVAVYGLREEHADGEPDHKLCAVCFQQGKKTILHSHSSQGRTYWDCRVCKTTEASGEWHAPRVNRRGSGWQG